MFNDDWLLPPVNTKSDQHEEEQNCPEEAARHGGNSIRVHDEHQTLPLHTHILHTQPLHFGHVAQHAEDDESRHEAGDAVDGAGEDGVLVAVVVELVVAGQGEQCSEPWSKREEDLCGCSYPNLFNHE